MNTRKTRTDIITGTTRIIKVYEILSLFGIIPLYIYIDGKEEA